MSEFDAKAFLANVPHLPGVYRMYDSKGTIIYVGKAKDLINACGAFFAPPPPAEKRRH